MASRTEKAERRKGEKETGNRGFPFGALSIVSEGGAKRVSWKIRGPQKRFSRGRVVRLRNGRSLGKTGKRAGEKDWRKKSSAASDSRKETIKGKMARPWSATSLGREKTYLILGKGAEKGSKVALRLGGGGGDS